MTTKLFADASISIVKLVHVGPDVTGTGVVEAGDSIKRKDQTKKIILLRFQRGRICAIAVTRGHT